MSNSVVCLQAANAIIGEGPVWDSAEGTLYWVDIKRPAVLRFDLNKGQTGHWPMPRPIGCLSPTCSKGRLVFADADGFGFLELATGKIERIANPESHLSGNRFNDGKVDRQGRFWAGTMDDSCEKATGSLYRLDRDCSVHRMATGFICSNGIGWSPDDKTMYCTDSMVRTIWAYEFDVGSGSLGERRVFARLADGDGVPDGLTVDAEGYVWSAIWDGWRLIRFAPDGSVDRDVPFPVKQPSSCGFGGDNLSTLFVTSACLDLDREALQEGPLAGALFGLPCLVPGLPGTPFGS